MCAPKPLLGFGSTINLHVSLFTFLPWFFHVFKHFVFLYLFNSSFLLLFVFLYFVDSNFSYFSFFYGFLFLFFPFFLVYFLFSWILCYPKEFLKIFVFTISFFFRIFCTLVFVYAMCVYFTLVGANLFNGLLSHSYFYKLMV